MQKLEEEEKKKEAIEELLDVRKQKDMSSFYRHLYRQTMCEEKRTERGNKIRSKDRITLRQGKRKKRYRRK